MDKYETGKKQAEGAKIYWIGAMGQMLLICIILAVLRLNQIEYPKGLDILFLIAGGSSTALWGIIVSLKYQYVSSGLKIIKDFFDIKQPPLYYGLVISFILVIFGPPMCSDKLLGGVRWYSFFIFFAQSIIFGGIEEIGWRYTWQPVIEKKIGFELACILTFLSWGVWHYMYFYLVGGIETINHMTFLIGLLGSCFILAAVYRLTKSLWLCVFYHCVLNAFSQILDMNSLPQVILTNVLGIILSIVLVRVIKPKEIDNLKGHVRRG